MQNVVAKFIVGRKKTINAEFSVANNNPIETNFIINAQPFKVSQLDNDLNFQTETQVQEAIQNESEVINNRIDLEVENLNERIDNIELPFDAVEGFGTIETTQENETLIIKSKTYVFEQGIPSSEWIINHNLNKFPTVTLVDSAGQQFITGIEYIDANNLIAHINGSMSGKAYLN